MRFALAITLFGGLAFGCGSSASTSKVETPGAEPAAPATPPSKVSGAGEACGGLMGLACAPGHYCSFAPEAMCGAADQTGVCAAVPEMCTEEYAPVCGCNDRTYSNACAAAREGISVSRTGECVAQARSGTLAEGATCGTRGVESECAAGLYCAHRENCGADDTGGVCSVRPEMCTKEYAPVCGCDGKTYGNGCEAAGAGASVASKGACPPSR